ncbi:DNA cytosine methyltransferase [Agrobacterium rhizogenes]|nr:DNA cytosine methyltransferase [Rhizobium rhizogenes]NTH59493.1 DNA cytosine methyltransferase [Rhizobium rhizogenes]NTH90644.1 DNA cytosine methyltransferase [Rhizobium rhizogenes]
MSVGLQRAGLEVIKAYDAWPLAVENYNQNVDRLAEVRDLKDILSIVPDLMRLAPDMIAGGPPCQDYSSAGRREEAANARLTLAFAMIVATVRPHWFLMENVTLAAKSATWQEARTILARAGYGLTESKIDASFYGVPQARRRLFVIGRQGERDGFLASSIAAAASAQPMSLRDLFGNATPAAMYFPARMPDKRSIWGPDEAAPTIRSSSDRPIPMTYRAHQEDAALIENGYVYLRPLRAGLGVRSIDEPASTITRTSWERPTDRYLSAPHQNAPVSAASAAVLSTAQLAAIQGFPPWWRWIATSKQDVMQMIANAVPAPVAEAIGRVILDREQGASTPAIEGGFLQWLVRRGRSPQSARNTKAQAGRARRLLGGRTFADPAREQAALESVGHFQALRKGTQSDLRQALRLLAEYRAEGHQRRRKPRQMPATVAQPLADAA